MHINNGGNCLIIIQPQTASLLYLKMYVLAQIPIWSKICRQLQSIQAPLWIGGVLSTIRSIHGLQQFMRRRYMLCGIRLNTRTRGFPSRTSLYAFLCGLNVFVVCWALFSVLMHVFWHLPSGNHGATSWHLYCLPVMYSTLWHSWECSSVQPSSNMIHALCGML